VLWACTDAGLAHSRARVSGDPTGWPVRAWARPLLALHHGRTWEITRRVTRGPSETARPAVLSQDGQRLALALWLLTPAPRDVGPAGLARQTSPARREKAHGETHARLRAGRAVALPADALGP